jgi:hypothetical protein
LTGTCDSVPDPDTVTAPATVNLNVVALSYVITLSPFGSTPVKVNPTILARPTVPTANPWVTVIVIVPLEIERKVNAFEVDVITSVLGVTADTVYSPDPPASGYVILFVAAVVAVNTPFGSVPAV